MYQPGIGIVSTDAQVISAIVGGLRPLFNQPDIRELHIYGDNPGNRLTIEPLPLYSALRDKAQSQLTSLDKPLALTLYIAESLEDLTSLLQNQQAYSLDMLLFDNQAGLSQATLVEKTDSFYQHLNALTIQAIRTPQSTWYLNPPPADNSLLYAITDTIEHYLDKRQPKWQAVLASQTLVDVMEYLVRFHCNPLLARKVRGLPARQVHSSADYGKRPISLASFMLEFFSNRVDDNWLFAYFTGSIIAPFIDAMESALANRQVTIINGCNEHSLACSALANWQLHQSPYLITVTCGMMLEFKGSLLNLKRSRARGFIVCGEGETTGWFAAQGMINAEEDVRKILDAMDIPWVYMQEPAQLDEDLRQAQYLYYNKPGPVVLLPTPRVLDTCRSLPADLLNGPSEPEVSTTTNQVPEEVMQILNQDMRKVLWVIDSPLSEQEQQDLQVIAEQAGIALADSVQRPGTVSAYQHGHKNTQYLGTLGVYGTSRPTLQYLYTDGELNSKDEQILFFLKSRLGQPSSPFPFGNFKTRLDTVQVTNIPEHMAPYVSRGLCMDVADFLHQVRSRLKVAPPVLAFRQKALHTAQSAPPSLLNQLPSSPMAPDYFYAQLNQLLTELITQQDYRYTGLFDAGRCGFGALCSVIRTDVGFSSIYGRGCMGDALMAFPLTALTSPANTIAFIGDGARSLVPDILPFVLKNLSGRQTIRGSATLFVFVNNSLSMVRTYQERAILGHAGAQMNSVNLKQPDATWQHQGVNINLATVHHFDPVQMRQWLTAKNQVNIIQVMTAHNNQGEMYRHFAADWYI
ncbi:hypothetical protein KJY73_15825 [Bowmanella sp. Y26]|uniref:hypothetical protein n=1 Tax=Bowmanella yangjiangensis TaxID=2811230 RepID=UPI001BDD85CA|nr:hypothetical protein [Bowmanella yangjiangensis]MBT1065061.1 hypothetical protein [Bowmanella yangjiangensis]